MILIDPDELVTAAETFSSRREPRTVTFAPVRAATWRDAICGVVTVVAPIDPRLYGDGDGGYGYGYKS